VKEGNGIKERSSGKGKYHIAERDRVELAAREA